MSLDIRVIQILVSWNPVHLFFYHTDRKRHFKIGSIDCDICNLYPDNDLDGLRYVWSWKSNSISRSIQLDCLLFNCAYIVKEFALHNCNVNPFTASSIRLFKSIYRILWKYDFRKFLYVVLKVGEIYFTYLEITELLFFLWKIQKGTILLYRTWYIEELINIYHQI